MTELWPSDDKDAEESGERLLAAGTAKMQVIGTLMHKLIRVIYGILKSRQPFDPDKLLPRSS
ncbi:MAG: hypothetical protein F6K00_01430 [Leptolyngbya sp. SIOISBB]|nr:hypothetical protein [Leptolyngbya sp. SIOISBB]